MPILGPDSAVTNNRYEDGELPRNTVHEVVPVELYAAKYTDGYGNTQMRFVAMMNGQPFLLPTDVSGQARAVQRWFREQMMEKLGQPVKKTTRTRRKKADEATDTRPHKPSKIKPLNVEAI